MSDCVFCDEFHAGPNKNFASRYPEIRSRILWADESLFAIPCIGQLEVGHFLVIPVQHHCTLRDTNSAVGPIGANVAIAIEFACEALGLTNRELLVFEHGARDPQDGGCGIYHAHLHVVPVMRTFDLPTLFDLQLSDRAKTLDDALAKIAPGSSYALAGIWGEEFRYQPLATPLPSQFMRRKVANALGKDQWDWRQSWREPAMLEATASIMARRQIHQQ